MNIGFFTDSYLPQLNGVAISVRDLAKSLRQRQHRVTVIAPHVPNYQDTEQDTIRLASVRVLKEPHIRMALLLPQRALFITVLRSFDIIHGFGAGPVTMLGMLLARAKKKPFVYTYNTRWDQYTHYILHGKVIGPKTVRRLNTIFCNWCDHIVVPTTPIKHELVSFGVKKPITVGLNGVDTAIFGKQKRGFLRVQLGLSDSDKMLLYVGRLSKEKSIHLLVEAFSLVAPQAKNAYLVLVGDGPDRKQLEELVKKYSLGKRVKFTGYIQASEIAKAYADADVFVFASTTETQGLVALEALASGVPVILSSDPVFADIVTHGYNGLLIKPTKEAFSESMLHLLDDEVYRRKLSENARKRALQFSLEETAKTFERLYESLTEKEKK